MVLLPVVRKIRHLTERLVTITTGIWFLARMRRAHMDLQPALLRKQLLALLTGILREMRVLVIHDQAFLADFDGLWTEPTMPGLILDLEGKCG